MTVTPEEITEQDARHSGFAGRAALLTALSKSTKEGRYHRVMLHLGGPDPQAELREATDLSDRELAEIEARLDAIDARSRRASWTREVLQLIEKCPGLRAVDLADRLGRDKLPTSSAASPKPNANVFTRDLGEPLEVSRRLPPPQTWPERSGPPSRQESTPTSLVRSTYVHRVW